MQRYSVTVIRADGTQDRVAYVAKTSLPWTVREVGSFGETFIDVAGSRFSGTVEEWLAANGATVVS